MESNQIVENDLKQCKAMNFIVLCKDVNQIPSIFSYHDEEVKLYVKDWDPFQFVHINYTIQNLEYRMNLWTISFKNVKECKKIYDITDGLIIVKNAYCEGYLLKSETTSIINRYNESNPRKPALIIYLMKNDENQGYLNDNPKWEIIGYINPCHIVCIKGDRSNLYQDLDKILKF